MPPSKPRGQGTPVGTRPEGEHLAWLEALVRTDERIRDEIAQIKTALGVEA